jgi:hypothetical protein
MTETVVWKPQEGPQTALVACPVEEVFYGGARGGGKTDGMLGDWLSHSGEYGERAVGVFFRRTYKQLSEVIARARQLFIPLGSSWNEQRAEFVMPNRARLLFRHLERDSDAENYQGHNYTRLYFEEITNFPSPAPINKLRATLRGPEGIKVGIRLTGNPGGPGHGWVKKRYIDPNKDGFQILVEEFVNPFTGKVSKSERVFIPARVIDNHEIDQDAYIARLQQTGSKQLVEAWLMGKWDIIDGAFFAEFDPVVHVLPAEWLKRIPPKSLIFRAFDWGYAKPFSVGWYAVSDGTWGLPAGAMVKFDEWYGCDGRPNEGLRMDAGMVGEGIKAKEKTLAESYGFRTRYGVADPSIFIRDGGPSIMEMMLKAGITWQRADNKREPGWQQVRRRLVGHDGKPMLYFLETCDDTLRTLPIMQHDDKDMEDLDTDGEDHAVDETRYACMSRPWVVDTVTRAELPFPRPPGQLTFNDVMAMNRKDRLQRESDARHGL